MMEASPAPRARGVLIAGGKATRMGGLVADLPKPLLPIGGKPVLAHQIDHLLAAGITDITVLAGFRADDLRSGLDPWVPPEAKVTINVEPEPAGSGGCLRQAEFGDESLVVLFGDVMIDMDLGELLCFHRQSGCTATAVVHPNDHPHDSDLAALSTDRRILTIHRKPHPEGLTVRNQVTAGVFVLEPGMLRRIPVGRKVDLVQDVLAPAIEDGITVSGYVTAEYLKDMGTPERYEAVEKDWRSGRIAALRRANLRPAAFLDRDGTLNRHVGYVTEADQIELLPGVARALRRLNKAGIWTLVVTNQPVIARGDCDFADLETIHGRLEMELGRQGAFVDGIYYCPHHPDSGFAGERPEYKRECSCRKPGTGLIEQACAEQAIDRQRSALFGDTWRDLEAAHKVGVTPYLIGSADDDRPLPPGTQVAEDLEQAVDHWLASISKKP